MSDLNTASPAAPNPLPPLKTPSPAGRRSWTRAAVLGAVLVGGVALGAGGLAAAAPHGWMMQGGPPIERMQTMARRALDAVGATSDQEAKVHDIIASAFADLAPMREKREAFRKQALDLLKAPTIDPAAIEKLRADHIAEMDTDSKRITKAVTDIATVLTPDQRAKLADRIEAFMERGPRGFGRDGMRRGMGGDGRWGDHGWKRDGQQGPRDNGPPDGDQPGDQE